MLAKNRDNRIKASKGSKGNRELSSRASEHSRASSYKDKAKKYYDTFGGKTQPHDHHNVEYATSTPQPKKDNQFLKKVTNFYLKNKDLEEEEIKLKSLKYLDKKGIMKDKI